MSTTLPRRAARLLSAAAVLALATACPQPPPPDTTAPAPASLTVANITDTSLQLRWTAVGDDGTDGTATLYELRSLSGAACPITQANFGTGTVVPGVGTPQAAGAAEAVTANGLSGDTTYCFMLQVTDDAGNSSFSGAAVATTTDLVAPSKATLALASASDTSATISWTSVGDNGVSGTATTYELRYLSGSACPIDAGNFASGTAVTGLPAPAAPGNSQQVTATGLASAVSYCFALEVSDEAGNSSLSDSLAVLTSDSVAPAAAALSVGAATGSTIAVNWTAVGDDGTTGTATSYELRYATGAAACPLTAATFSSGTAVSGLPTPSAAGTAETFTVTGLTSDTAYCFMLKVTDDVGNSSLSNSAAGSTRDVTAPAAAAISTANATGSSVRVDWLAVGDDGSTGTATAYDLRYASGSACPLAPATFDAATAVTGLPSPSPSGTAESVTVTGLGSDTAYCFMLQVTDDAGNTSFSNSAGAQTLDVTAPASASLSAGTVAANSIQVLWTAVGDDGSTGTATAYDLRYRSGAGCPLDASNFAGATQVTGLSAPRAAGQPESFIVQGLSSDTSYCFLLQVTDDAGNSSFSNSLAQSTPDVTPPAAVTLTAAVFDTSFQLNWTAVGDDGTAGTATSQELRYLSGSACPIDASNFDTGTLVPGLGAPAASGTPETFTAGGLTRQTQYCFALKVADEVGNASISNTFTATTPDTTAPAAATLTGTASDTSVDLGWTAVGDDGTSGTATSQELRYLSGSACPISAANFDTGTLAPGLGAPAAAGTPETFTVSGLTRQTQYCFALKVTDDAGNSSFSNAFTATTPDTTAPASAGLSAAVFDTSFMFNWMAVGDDGTSGTAASQEMRYLSGSACPIDVTNFDTGTLAPGLGAPAASGTPETLTVSGLTRQTQYCFALKVTDDAGNSSLSNTFTATTPDTSAPDAAALSTANIGIRSMHVTWTAVGDDGATGTATSYELRYLSGAACPVTSGNFSSGTLVATGSPQASGSAEDVTVSGLTQNTAYCFALKVTDDAGNSSLSNSAGGTTLADVTPPGPVGDLAVGTTTATSIQLGWTAPADDGSTAASGPASAYDLRYLTGAACPISAGNFATGTAVSVGAPGTPGSPESVTASGLATGASYCFLLQVTDAAGNSSFSNSASGIAVDSTPPAAVADLAATGPDASGQIGLSWTATGDDGTTGTATSYDLRYSTGPCASFNFATATPLTGLPAPAPAGTAQSYSTTLSPFGQYCFGLQVADEVGLSSISNFAGAAPDPVAQLAQIRNQIHSAASAPVSLNAGVGGAIVTYLKAAVGGAPAGSIDGPGFFIQNGATGPAIFVAMDPAAVLPGMAVSDTIDLGITQADWLGCAAPPCTADNSMYVVTQATAAPVSTGAALPTAQDLTSTPVPVPIGAGPWAFEHERVSITSGTLGAFSASGTGFEQAQISTATNNSPLFQFRLPDPVITAKGVATGCRATVTGTPMWRFDANAQIAAWQPSEVALTNCPGISIASVSPSDASRNVPVTATYAVSSNQPLTPASLSMQAANGACTGTVQMSADTTFVNCVGGTFALSGLNNAITITPAAPLAPNTRYRARLANPAASPNGNTVPTGTGATTINGFVTDGPAPACTARAVVISQVYGGGGNSGAVYKNDFIELHNRSNTAVSLAGWSVQYASATGTGWTLSNSTALSGTIAPGGYFLIQEAPGAGGTLNLPTPDVTGTIAMGAGAGKVALVSSTTVLTGQCPASDPTLVDLVGYGATANCSLGLNGPTVNLINTTSAQREESACWDTNSNFTDFASLVTAPRNSASPAVLCSCP